MECRCGRKAYRDSRVWICSKCRRDTLSCFCEPLDNVKIMERTEVRRS